MRDFMSRRDRISDLVRLVQGLRGSVPMRTELKVRFDYGFIVPWVSRRPDGRLQFTAGPDRVLLDTSMKLRGEDLCYCRRVSGKRWGGGRAFPSAGHPSYRAHPPAVRARRDARESGVILG